jgi:hypothetical protein
MANNNIHSDSKKRSDEGAQLFAAGDVERYGFKDCSCTTHGT